MCLKATSSREVPQVDARIHHQQAGGEWREADGIAYGKEWA